MSATDSGLEVLDRRECSRLLVGAASSSSSSSDIARRLADLDTWVPGPLPFVVPIEMTLVTGRRLPQVALVRLLG